MYPSLPVHGDQTFLGARSLWSVTSPFIALVPVLLRVFRTVPCDIHVSGPHNLM